MDILFRPTSTKRLIFFVIVDSVLSLISLYLAYQLRFNFHVPQMYLSHFWHVYITLTIVKVIALYIFKNYFIIWRFFSFVDSKNIVLAHTLSYGLFVVLYLLFTGYYAPFARSIIIIDFFLSLSFIGAVRASKRFLLERGQSHISPTLLIGVNSNTGTVIQSAIRGDIPYYPVAIISLDNDISSKNTYIHNIKVHEAKDLDEVINDNNITSVIFVERLLPKALKPVVDILNARGITDMKQVKLLGDNNEKLEDLSIEDLLARHPKDLNLRLIEDFIKDKSILITGAGGSIGSEIVHQCSIFGASRLILVDSSEFNLYQIGQKVPDADLRLLNVTDTEIVDALFDEVMPDIVIHAAAYKHVPICELNPEVAVKNNILGTKNVIDSSVRHTVEKLVVISTDKAVRPTNVMGATKRVTELYAQNVDSKDTEIVAVRFGNVLGSSGSVIPKFKEQIESGGPVTVTHPDITRYFMLIPEACQLVLQTAAIAKGGELFILDMGEPIKIVDLAKQMIRLYGKEDEIEVVFTGLRPGEKLYEELLLDESEQKTKYSSIFIARPTYYDITQLTHDIEVLLEAKDKVGALQKIVPEFTRKGLI
jgi:UDP-N-acetyl-D-glucosamine 4,6-dehydratase